MHALRVFLFSSLLCAGLAQADPQASARIETHHVGSRKLTVVLPPGYEARGARRYPVVFMLDGQNVANRDAMHGGWRADETLAHAVHQRHIEPVILVGVHAADRMHEYTPTRDAEHDAGGGAQAFFSHLERDIVPWVDRQFATHAHAEGRAIAGASLGGLAALHGVTHHSNLFSKGMIFSPSLWWDDHRLVHEVKASPTIARSKVYLYNGGEHDGRAASEALRDTLHQKGMRFSEQVFHYTDPEGEHNERAWSHYFGQGLRALFPRQP